MLKSISGDNRTEICGAAKIACYNEAEDKLSKKHFIEGLKNDNLVAAHDSCNCLPSCTSITYDAEISQTSFNWVALFTAYDNPIDEFPG